MTPGKLPHAKRLNVQKDERESEKDQAEREGKGCAADPAGGRGVSRREGAAA